MRSIYWPRRAKPSRAGLIVLSIIDRERTPVLLRGARPVALHLVNVAAVDIGHLESWIQALGRRQRLHRLGYLPCLPYSMPICEYTCAFLADGCGLLAVWKWHPPAFPRNRTPVPNPPADRNWAAPIWRGLRVFLNGFAAVLRLIVHVRKLKLRAQFIRRLGRCVFPDIHRAGPHLVALIAERRPPPGSPGQAR